MPLCTYLSPQQAADGLRISNPEIQSLADELNFLPGERWIVREVPVLRHKSWWHGSEPTGPDYQLLNWLSGSEWQIINLPPGAPVSSLVISYLIGYLAGRRGK